MHFSCGSCYIFMCILTLVCCAAVLKNFVWGIFLKQVSESFIQKVSERFQKQVSEHFIQQVSERFLKQVSEHFNESIVSCMLLFIMFD